MRLTNKLRALFLFFYNLAPMVVKIWGINLFLIILIGGIFMWQVNMRLEKELRLQLVSQGLAHAESIASFASNYILLEDHYGLYELLSEAQAKNEVISYIFILDSQGQTVIDTLQGRVPEELVKLNSITGKRRYNEMVFNSPQGIMHDIAVPVGSLKNTTLRLGVSEVGIENFLANQKKQMLIYMLTVALAGLGISFILAQLITKPIKSLISSMRVVGTGKLDHQVKLTGFEDEVGQLVSSFNQMLSRLAGMNSELRKKDIQRQALLRKIMIIQEEERKRISRELHDEVGQTLTFILLSLKVLQQNVLPKGEELVSELRTMISEKMDDLKDLAISLRPNVLDNLGLEAAIRSLTDQCQKNHNLFISVCFSMPKEARLEPMAESAIYRIVQESLANTVKHAQATRVRISLRISGRNLILYIADNGRGFKLDKASSMGLGLVGMDERAALFNGTFKLYTKYMRGTLVKIEFPSDEVIVYGDKSAVS